MEFSVKSGSAAKQRNASVVVGVFDRRKLPEQTEAFDELTDGAVSAVTRRGDMDGKPGQIVTIYNAPNTFCDRLILVGLGKERDFNDNSFRKAMTSAAQALMKLGGRDAAVSLSSLKVKGRDDDWKLRQAVQAFRAAAYRYDTTKSTKAPETRLARVVFTISTRKDGALESAQHAVAEAEAIANGCDFAKLLSNLPGNICTPTYLAEQAKALSKAHKNLSCTILEESDMEDEGMGALLSVSRGSRQPAKLIVLEYKGGKKGQQPVALVGKGLTFDAGGISVKPAAGMDEMKYDMCGGASVLGAMKSAVELKLPINIVAVVPSSENLPDGNANKPGDIVTSMAGKTIEVLNTDAEGRLILCDALTYTARYNPAVVIDVATLTGACVIALGSHATGMFSNNRPLARALQDAGDETGDRVWEMPLWDDYQQQLKSNFADMANIGGREAGSITAACFLARFTKEYRWAHLDIAGTAWNSGANKGATGRPVPLLVQFLLDRIGE